VTYPKITKTADPRVRLAQNGPHDFRTQVQDEAGADWAITGPVYLTRAEALLRVDETVSRHFGEPTHDRIRSLMAQVERLTAQNAEMQAKIYAEEQHNGALMVDADRREQRALALLPDCEAHKREIHYLRHMASWNWHTMNDAEEARQAIVGALGNTVLAIKRGAGPTVSTAELLTWLEAAIAKQKKPLGRKSYPTLADCLRSDNHGCEHKGLSASLVADIAKALGLTAP
jgi:hypothetical protein